MKYRSKLDDVGNLIEVYKIRAGGEEYLGEKSMKAIEYGIGTFPVIASSQTYIANTRQYLSKEVKEALETRKTLAQSILDGAANVKEVSHYISANMVSESWYQNSVQHTYNVMTEIQNLIKQHQKKYVTALDTEWLGGEKFPATPIEIGVSVGRLENGQVIPTGKKRSIFIQMDEQFTKKVEEIIKKVEEDRRNNLLKPRLNSEEHRILRDLIKYSGDVTKNPEDIINKHVRVDLLQGVNFFDDEVWDKVLKGFENLKHGTSNPHAIERSKVGAKIIETMFSGGWTVEDNPIFIWQNGINADIKVWFEAFAGDRYAQYILNRGRHVDIYSVLKSITKDPLSIHKHSKRIKGPLRLESLVASVLGEGYSAHIASEDAHMTLKLFGALVKDKQVMKKIQGLKVVGEEGETILGKGSYLISTGSIRSNSPLDSVLEYIPVKGRRSANLVAARNQPFANYKNAIHKIMKEFEYEYEGKIYYGVVLKNIDDDVISVIARESRAALVNEIQANFQVFSKSSKEVLNKHKALRKFVNYDRAVRAYTSMFKGREAAYNFEVYTNALKYIINNPSEFGNLTYRRMVYGGRLNKKLTKKLVDAGLLTTAKARNFANMFPRLWSEKDILLSFREQVFDKLISSERSVQENIRSTALYMFKQEMDNILGGHSTVLQLPEAFKQGKLLGKTVNMTSVESLTSSIVKMITEGKKYSRKWNFADTKEDLKDIVIKLGRDNILSKTEVKKTLAMIDKVDSFHGTTRGAQDIARHVASLIYDRIPLEQEIEISESLTKRKLTQDVIEKIVNKDKFTSIMNLSQRYFSKDGGLVFYDPKAIEKIRKIDSYILRNLSQFTDIVVTDLQRAPRTIESQLDELVRNFSKRGVTTFVEMATGKDKQVGLILKLVADQHATQILNGNSKVTAEIFIPLVNPDTGLITNDGLSLVNIMRLTKNKNAGVWRLSTYQDAIFEELNKSHVVDKIARALTREGTPWVVDATKTAKKVIKDTMEGIPTGNRYSSEIIKGLQGTTEAANLVRKQFLDLTELIEEAKSQLKNPKIDDNMILRMILYGEESDLQKIGITSLSTFRKIRDILEQLGLRPHVLGTKGEVVKKFIVSVSPTDGSKIDYSDPRRFGAFGTYGDNIAKENMRSFLNYYALNEELMDRNIDALKSKGIVIDKHTKKRLVTKLVADEEFYKLTKDEINTLNVKAAFLTDEDIVQLAKQKGIDLDKIPIPLRPTVRDDMMILREDIARMFVATREKKIILDLDQEIDEIIRKALDEGQEVFIKPGSKIGTNGQIYNEKYVGWIKAYTFNEEKQAWEIAVEQAIETKFGTKFQIGQGGTKLTSNIAIIDDEGMDVISKLTGRKDIEALIYLNPKKYSGDFISSQLALVAAEALKLEDDMATIGKATKKDIQEGLIKILEKAGVKNDQIRFSEDGNTLLIPRSVKDDINLRVLTEEVNKYLREVLQTDGNIINIGDKKITIGMVQLGMTQVEDWTGAVGAYGGKARMTNRELEFLYTRSKYLIKSDISQVVQHFQNVVLENSEIFTREGHLLHQALVHAAGKELAKQSELGIIRLKPVGGETDKYFKEIYFTDLREIISKKSSHYLTSELKGTIVDPDLFEGKAFDLELPFEVVIDEDMDLKVSKVRMAPIHLQGDKFGIHLTEVQKKQKAIFEAIANYRKYIDATDEEGKRLFEQSVKEIKNAVKGYYLEAAKAVHYSKGYIAKNVMSKEMQHSAHLNIRGVSGADYIDDAIKNKLDEGYAIISRKDLKKMFEGVKLENSKDIDIDYILKKAETEGILSIGTRYPTKEYGSQLPIKLKVLSEAEEKRIIRKLGEDALSGNIWITLGTQTRLTADFDGDRMAIFLPKFSGMKVKTTEALFKTTLMKQMEDWFIEEQKYTKPITEEMINELKGVAESYAKTIRGIAEDGSDIIVKSELGETFAERVKLIESRLKKDVGKFSNMSTRLRRYTETIGTMKKKEISSQIYNIIEIFGSAIEQAPISAKKMGEILGNVEIQDFSRYVMASDKLYEGLKYLDVDKIIEGATDLGFFDENGIFVGAAKSEGVIGKHVSNRGKQITKEQVRNALNTLIETMPQELRTTWSSSNTKVFLSNVQSAGEGILRSYAVETLGETTYVKNYIMDMFLKHGIDRPDIVEKLNKMDNVVNIFNEVFNNLSDEELGPIIKELESGGILTYGDDINKAARSIFSEIDAGKIGGIGVAALGATWLIGSVLSRPKPKEQLETRPDQAPSSDGTYVDPSIYAGAPPGAEPPIARLLERGKGYEKIRVRVSAKSINGLTNEEIAALISQEIQRQTNINMNISITSKDDRTTIDRNWLQEQFANLLNNGYAH